MSNLGMAPSPRIVALFASALRTADALPGVPVGIQDLHILVLTAGL